MEQYFSGTDDNTTDYLIEGVMKSIINSARIAIDNPADYEARSNIMWCATLGLNTVTGLSKEQDWEVHMIEHQVGAYTDCPHGVGLAIVSIEKMNEFFENRIDGYDEHMMTNIESADEFYSFTAKTLPMLMDANILDLGCGTGLELHEYFALNSTANVTGIDLSQGMLDKLKSKFSKKQIKLICDSYFDVSFGENIFDAAVSVESLHHFTKEAKIPLYDKLCKSLKSGGYFILTDYFSLSDVEETEHFENFKRLKAEQNINDNEFYHFDTPLTVEHEIEALISAGFSSVEILKNWGATYALKAIK